MPFLEFLGVARGMSSFLPMEAMRRSERFLIPMWKKGMR